MFGDYPEEYGEVMTEYSQEDDRRTQRDVGEVPRRGACGSRIAYCRLRRGEVFVRRCEVQTVHENANVLEDEVQSVGDELHCSRTLNFIFLAHSLLLLLVLRISLIGLIIVELLWPL